MGGEDHRPDYDYAALLKLRLYQPINGQEASCRIVRTDGSVVGEITAVRKGNEIRFCLQQSMQEVPVEIFAGHKTYTFTIPAGVTEATMIIE